MEHRKNPNKDLRRQSGLFFQIGLLIALMVCVSAFEYKTKETTKPVDFGSNTEETDVWTPPVSVIPPPQPPKPKIANPVEVKNEEVIEMPDDITIDPLEFENFDPPKVIDEPKIEKAEEIFIIVEDKPMPEGGFNSFYNFVRKNLKYPRQAKNMGVEGKVYVQFVVDKTGELTDIKVIKGIGAGCDEEVLRMMKLASKWKAGMQRGMPVKVKTVIPISFQLN